MTQKNQTALITGSGRNIGKGIALRLAASGFNIVLNGSQNRDACDAVASEIRSLGMEVAIEMCNIGDRDKVLDMASSVIGRFGRIDVLVNNAAVRPQAGFLDIPEDEWHRVMDINFYAAFHLARACLPGMIASGWGRIVNFTGMNAQQGNHARSSVTVSKHAMWGLTKSLAIEFGTKGVTSNIISPGTFPDETADLSTPHFEALLKANPVGRLGAPDDISAMVDLLVSDEGGFINGQMLQINGGAATQF